jgi:solute carrier family 25 (mitochondrial uncoupling protein), member 8/9
MVNVISRMVKEEGITSLYKGLSPGVQRQCVYGGIRLMLYEPIRDAIHSDKTKEIPLYKKSKFLFNSKVVAGILSGAIAITIANPTDLVKIRLQGAKDTKLYNGSFDAYQKIIKTSGVKSLWTGLGPNIVRNATIHT